MWFSNFSLTIHQLSYINSSIKIVFNKNYLLRILYNIIKAFYIVWKYKIILKLHSWNIRENILYFIRNFLSSTDFMVKITNITVFLQITLLQMVFHEVHPLVAFYLE